MKKKSRDEEIPVVRGGSFSLKAKEAKCGISENLGQITKWTSPQYNKIGLRIAATRKNLK